MKEDFLFVAKEAYFKATSWRLVSRAYGCSIAGRVPEEKRMYVRWRLSTVMLCST